MRALYIHIPFCRQICTYCDFVKEVADDAKKDAYMQALKRELSWYSHRLSTVETIYIGGGTPSSLSLASLDSFLQVLFQEIDPNQIKECTIEANPSDVDRAFAQLLARNHVNRVSLGVQSFDDATLSFLNRDHDASMITRAVFHLKSAGLDNINIDMIFAVPAQTLKDLQRDLRYVLELNVSHISYYNLILEAGTRLYTLYQKGRITLMDEDTEASMYETVIDTLNAEDYVHYEISSFAKPGFESVHNRLVWEDYDYLGLGSGAHSKYDAQRFFNTPRVKHYMEKIANDTLPVQPYDYDVPGDTLLLGMRLLKGVDLSAFEARFGKSVFAFYPKLKQFLNAGYLVIEANRLKLTRKGLLIGNEIFGLF